MKNITVTEYKFASKKIPAPLRFAVVPDIHEESLDFIMEGVVRCRPDAILIPGDLTDDLEDESTSAYPVLREMVGLAPTFLSLGNHEKYATDRAKELLSGAGVTLLCDTYTEFCKIKLCGLSSGFHGKKQGNLADTPKPDLAALDSFDRLDGFRLLLCHHPEYYPEYISKTGIELTVSGHAHGGQWRIFGHGIFAPGQGFFPRLTCGLYDGRLLVSRGCSNHSPVPRINNPPELISLELTPR